MLSFRPFIVGPQLSEFLPAKFLNGACLFDNMIRAFVSDLNVVDKTREGEGRRVMLG